MTDSQAQVEEPVTPALHIPALSPTAQVASDVKGGDPVVKGRRRAPGADPEVRSFGTARTCSADGCATKLSRYNPDVFCSVHRGWDRQVVTRRRRVTGLEEAGIADAGSLEQAE